MTFGNNFIKYCFGRAHAEDIAECEKEIGIIFPVAFKEKSLKCDGGTPTKDVFNYYSTTFNRHEGSCLGGFLLFSQNYPHPSELLLESYKKPPEFFPECLVAFAEVGNGDQICFDYREGKDNLDPPIVIWEHEGDEGNDVSYLAPNFEAFMNMLMDEEEAEKEFARLLKESQDKAP